MENGLFAAPKWINTWGKGQTPFASYTLSTDAVLNTDSIHTPPLPKSSWNIQAPSLISGGKPKIFHTIWPGQSASSHVTLATRNYRNTIKTIKAAESSPKYASKENQSIAAGLLATNVKQPQDV